MHGVLAGPRGYKTRMSDPRDDFNPEVNEIPTDDAEEETVGDPTLDEEPRSAAVIDPEPSSNADHVEPEPEPT